MPRESYVSLLLCAAIILIVECSGIRDRCSELIRLDVNEIEMHLSELNLTDVPTVKMMTAGFKCSVSTLPFGTLKSDWARLLLLREAQPDASIIKLKLVRLMRLLIIAYYQMEERIDVTGPEEKSTKRPSAGETSTTVSGETSQPHCPNSGNSLGAETSSSNAKGRCSCTDSFPSVTRLATKDDCSRIKSNATVIESATMEASSSPSGTTTVSSDAPRQNVTAPIDLDAAAYYSGNAKKAALKVLGNCLKYSLKDVARQSSGKVFEKDKTRYTERAARKDKEIGDRARDHRAVIKISPSTNEFWRYVTFPTRAPLNVGSVAPGYRVRLSGLRAGPRKSRKRMKLNNDIYESFRRFYGVGRNEEGTK